MKPERCVIEFQCLSDDDATDKPDVIYNDSIFSSDKISILKRSVLSSLKSYNLNSASKMFL